MSEHESRSAKDLFNVARMLPSDERAAYLDEACGGDAELRREVDQLLADYEAAGSFLESPTLPLESTPGDGAVGETTSADPSEETPGTLIGRYKILQQIGEGGFGRVYMAEQTKPIVRRVALKVIKLGMDTRQVIARFEAERQALAMMDHPNIAKVLEAGATSTGRPYFVMELVRGEPITEYCDRNNLSIPERLDLFMQVCRAVQHAHQKGIIHRDLKPTNVMITIADGKPMPKVIDFGIAKATNARLTEKTLFTEFRQLIGTPQYMSPEQAEASGVDIDTRSDIYSLGVLLYELLTGATPFDPARLRSAAFGEIQRIIREEEPPKPSTRLSTLKTLPSVAAHRHTEPKRLSAIIRGDLDWIVMKMLEKDRTRRYETADAVAQDVERHLNHEPVLAGPPSRGYKVRKFIVRHKVGVAASMAIAVALVLGVIGTSGGMAWALSERAEAIAAKQAEAEQRQIAEENERRAIEEAQRAEREAERALAAETAERERADELEKVAEFQASQLSEIDVPMVGVRLRRDLIEKRQAAMERAGRDEDEIARGLEELERSLAGINFTDVALATLDENIFERALKAIDEQFADQPLLKARLLQTLAITLRELGLYDAAMPPQEQALEIRRSILGVEHPDTMISIREIGTVHQSRGEFSEAEPYLREALEVSKRLFGNDHRQTSLSRHRLGALLRLRWQFAEAEQLFKEALGEILGRVDADHPESLSVKGSLALVLSEQQRYSEAAPYYQTVLDGSRRQLGDDHPNTMTAINNMAQFLQGQGRVDEAEPYYRESMERRRRVMGDEHPRTLDAIHNMGVHLRYLGRYEEAEQFLREAVSVKERLFGRDHWSTLTSMNSLAVLLVERGKLDEAETFYRHGLDALGRMLGPDHPQTLTSMHNLGFLLYRRGQLQDAEPLMRESTEGRRRVHGDEHPLTLISINNMGLLLSELGRMEEAEKYSREAMDARRRVLGNEHPHTLGSILNVGSLLRQQGRLSDAEPYYREALDGSRQALGNDHPVTLHTIHGMGRLLADIGQFDRAVEFLREAQEGRTRVLGEGHPDTLATHTVLVDCLLGAGRRGEAVEVAADMLERMKQHHASSPGAFAGSLAEFALMALEVGEARFLDDAERAARQCLEIRQRLFADEHSDAWLRHNAASLLGGVLLAKAEITSDAERERARELIREAEPLLLSSAEWMLTDPRMPRPAVLRGLDRAGEASDRAVRLYELLERLEPGRGHADEAARWGARLEEWREAVAASDAADP
jgi:eukaryotic-like serine/threonine-protein kinase